MQICWFQTETNVANKSKNESVAVDTAVTEHFLIVISPAAKRWSELN